MEKSRFSHKRLLFVASCFLSLYAPVSAQAPLSQMDSTVTVSPEGDTVVTYQLRETDFGRNVICQYAERKTLTKEEREKNYERYREARKNDL